MSGASDVVRGRERAGVGAAVKAEQRAEWAALVGYGRAHGAKPKQAASWAGAEQATCGRKGREGRHWLGHQQARPGRCWATPRFGLEERK